MRFLDWWQKKITPKKYWKSIETILTGKRKCVHWGYSHVVSYIPVSAIKCRVESFYGPVEIKLIFFFCYDGYYCYGFDKSMLFSIEKSSLSMSISGEKTVCTCLRLRSTRRNLRAKNLNSESKSFWEYWWWTFFISSCHSSKMFNR